VQFFNGELTPKLQVQRRSDSSSVKGTAINGQAINGTAQILQGVDMPAQQQENPDSVTASDPVFSKLDTVQLNLSTGKENPGAKGNITQENSADRVFQNTSERDKEPTVQKSNSAVRPQEVKAKSGSFHKTGNAIETDGVASPSATASNADSVGTMDSLKSSNSSDMITGSDDGPQLQPLEPASGGSVANFAREGQTEKTSLVNSSSNEPRPVNQSFHTEVVKQVVDKTASTLKSGQSEMQIDLKPESLGHLRLHVSMENQQVTVKILAENTQVKEMIERQASLIKSELQHQGIKVDAVNVDLLMSGGTDFASSHHEETAFKQARHEPAYSKGQESTGESGFKEPDSPSQANSRGGNLVNYFA
jgi:flagellar hook-length control protein FliK